MGMVAASTSMSACRRASAKSSSRLLRCRLLLLPGGSAVALTVFFGALVYLPRTTSTPRSGAFEAPETSFLGKRWTAICNPKSARYFTGGKAA